MSDIKLKRALSIRNVLDKKFERFEFTSDWFDAFGQPQKQGVWFIWGNSGNGKTSFVLQLMKQLSQYGKVLFNSLEEATDLTLQESYDRLNMIEANGKIDAVTDNIEEFTLRLSRQKSPKIVVIDSFQYFGLTYAQYKKFKEQFRDKLIVFISQADGKNPKGPAADSVMYDAALKIRVEGHRAISKGRYIGPKGYYTIWAEKAAEYWMD